MNIQNFTDLELHQSAIQTAEKERAVTLLMLKHLNEIERRRLYSKYSASSLHAYCVQYLKMSDPQAGRRVAASRLLSDLPVIEEKVLSGSMSLTSVSQAAVFFKKEAQSGNPFAKAEKLEVIQELEAKPTREVERILISKSVTPSLHLKESVKPKTVELTEVKLHLDQETMKDLERLREIWSHAMPGATLANIIKRTAKECRERHDPLKKAERAEKKGQTEKKS